MIVHVCHNDGAPAGEFPEADFRDKIFAGELTPEYFYWYEGMAEWKPISEYRALAKTQRIEILPEPAQAVMAEEPIIVRSNDSANLIKGVVLGVLGIILAIIGGVSSSLMVGGVGGLLVLAGIYLGVAARSIRRS